MNKIWIEIILFGLIALSSFFRCSSPKREVSRIGAPIPETLNLISLADILLNPKVYQDREVLLAGRVSYFCASGCEFNFQEGTNSIKVFSDLGAKILPLLKKETSIRIYGKVKGGDKPFLILLGLEVK